MICEALCHSHLAYSHNWKFGIDFRGSVNVNRLECCSVHMKFHENQLVQKLLGKVGYDFINLLKKKSKLN
jgi:hypothetical protein